MAYNQIRTNLVNLFSENRLNSYRYDSNDDNSIILERYLYNIEVSKALYPILSILEISLRNRIFHHEIVINYPYGIENCYNDLKRLLSYISKDSVMYLDKICDFKNIVANKKP